MSRYLAAHKNYQGPGDARPTALQIVEDEGLIGKLSGKVFLVTGVSSGIGVETLRALYATGAHVFGTARDVSKAQQIIDDIKSSTAGGEMTLIEMELDSLASIKKAAENILSQTSTINVIINNAGVMATSEGRTKDGFETQFGINHIGHFYLFQLLKDTLLRSATPNFPSRVVSVSSFGHRNGEIRFDDYNFEKKDSYTPWLSYGQAKTANIYFANEIERRYASKDLHSTSLHPGGIWTGLQKHVGKDSWTLTEEQERYMKNAEQGAATSVYAALSEEWKHKGGKYLADCVAAPPFASKGNPMATGDDGYEEWAYDEEKAKRLWQDSLKMLDLQDDQT